MGLNDDAEDDDRRREGRDTTYPSGPMPPHERVWRHPSELGFAAVKAADAAPVNIGRTGRSLLGVSTIGGALLLAALFFALQPTAPRPDARDVIALTNSELRIAALDKPTSVTIELAAELAETQPGVGRDAVGIMLPSGDLLITTLTAIDEVETIDIRFADGRTVRAQVVQTYPDLSVAVLSVSDQPTATADPEIDVMSIVPRGVDFIRGQAVMALVDVPQQFTVSDPIDNLLVALRSSSMSDQDMARVAEGAPIVDKSGKLVGLCTHAAGVLGFIPFIEIEEALANWIIDAGGVRTKQR